MGLRGGERDLRRGHPRLGRHVDRAVLRPDHDLSILDIDLKLHRALGQLCQTGCICCREIDNRQVRETGDTTLLNSGILQRRQREREQKATNE